MPASPEASTGFPCVHTKNQATKRQKGFTGAHCKLSTEEPLWSAGERCQMREVQRSHGQHSTTLPNSDEWAEEGVTEPPRPPPPGTDPGPACLPLEACLRKAGDQGNLDDGADAWPTDMGAPHPARSLRQEGTAQGWLGKAPYSFLHSSSTTPVRFAAWARCKSAGTPCASAIKLLRHQAPPPSSWRQLWPKPGQPQVVHHPGQMLGRRHSGHCRILHARVEARGQQWLASAIPRPPAPGGRPTHR